MIAAVKIILVNWNSKEDTLECLNSLIEAGAVPENLIVVDNGSTDGSFEAFSSFSKELQLIRNSKNLDFAPALNQGIELALSQSPEWILLLNNDTKVSQTFFEELSNAINSDPGYQIYAPLIFYYSDPDRIWYLGDYTFMGTLITLNKYQGKKYRTGLPGIVPTDFVNGCGMLVKREVFEKVGLFDPMLEMYGEEVDFCWRARIQGFRFACVTKAKMWHKVSTSARRNPPRTIYLRTRNQIRFYKKYSKGLHRIFLFFFTIIRTSWIAIKDLGTERRNLIKPLISGFVDGWKNS